VQAVLGWIVLILGGALYLAQIISSVNFRLAQRMGIQEKPEETDALVQRSERYTAYWDLVTLGCLPLAGALMITNHAWWPVLSLIGGAIYLDTAGREAMKTLSFRHEGIRAGTDKQQKVFFASYLAMGVIAIVLMVFSVSSIVLP